MDDKLKVDDALISTDVDRLIRCISEKKKASLWDLQKACDINRRELDKWVRVLEDEGYIRIEYGITGTYVKWMGPTEEDEVREIQRKNSPEAKEDYRTSVEEERAKIAEPKSFDYSGDDRTPEELLQKYVTMKKREEDGDEDELKSNILKNFDDDDYTVPEKIKEHDDLEFPVAEEEKEPEGNVEEYEPIAEIEEEKDEEEFFRYKDDRDEEFEGEMEPEEEREELTGDFGAVGAPEENEGQDEPSEPDVPEDGEVVEDEPLTFQDDEPEEKFVKDVPKSIYDSEVRDMLNSYVHEINGEKAELHKLEKQKDELYRNKMVSLESKMETDIASLTNYILEHESKLLEMKEGVLELPDKVEEITRIQTEVRNLSREGKRSLKETKEKVENMIAVMKSTEKDLRGRITETRSSMEREEAKIDDLNRLRESIEAKSEKMINSLESMQGRISELNEKMDGLASEMEQAGEIKAEIENKIEVLRNDIDVRGSELDGIEEDLRDIVKLEGWARRYISDYEDKVDEIDAYVRKSDQELASVREAAEASYLKRYLGELETITGKYEEALDGILSDEKNIEDRIAEKKRKIRQLVKESQEMIKRIRSETEDSPDYEEMKKKIERRTAKAKNIVEEKAQEGEKLHEEVKKKKSKRKKKKD